MNKKNIFTLIGASNHSELEREKNDYYATHPIAIDYLLKKVEIPFSSTIWECACGEGHLSKRLIELGYTVRSSDLIDRNYGEISNFFEHTEKLDENTLILTNPPYKYAMEFVLHALDLLSENAYCIMFLKLTFLEGQKRFSELFRRHPPKTILVFSKRMNCARNGNFEVWDSSAIAYCWYIWEKGYKGKPTIEWI